MNLGHWVLFQQHLRRVDVRSWAREAGIYLSSTRRGRDRARRWCNRERRAWLLSLELHDRHASRLDLPSDYDDMPF